MFSSKRHLFLEVILKCWVDWYKYFMTKEIFDLSIIVRVVRVKIHFKGQVADT